MIVYWTMYGLPAFLALFNTRVYSRSGRQLACALIIFQFFLIGFRQTGGDFTRYEILFEIISEQGLIYATTRTEILYGFLNWVVHYFGLPFLAVTLLTSLIYSFCLWRFVRAEPLPLLALAIATAYMTIVVAMGYTRQGVALSLVMLATLHIRQGRLLTSLMIVALATGFHSSAALAFGLTYHAVQAKSKFASRTLGILLITFSAYGAYSILQSEVDLYIQNYVDSNRYVSGGAVQRLLLCWIAAIIVLWYRKSFVESERALWVTVSVVSLGTFFLLWVSSTVADRFGLYLLPLQVVAFGRLPLLYGRKSKQIIAAFVLAGYLMVLGTWLLLGNFADDLWLPYRSALFGVIS